MAEYVNIRIRKDTYERLKELSAGVPLVRFLDDACRHWSKDNKDADALLEELDNKYENPSVDPLLEGLAPGELPECCQGIYDDPERPVPTCEHWEKAWVNHYGNKVVHYKNKLTGGSYFDYFNTYVN